MSEPLEYKIGWYIDRKRYKTPEARERARARAAREFIRNGDQIEGNEVIPGVRMVASWRNPKNKNPLHSNWKNTTDEGQSLADFFTTLHGRGGALRDFTARYA